MLPVRRWSYLSMIIPGGGALWQQKVPLYYEDDPRCPSRYIIYL